MARSVNQKKVVAGGGINIKTPKHHNTTDAYSDPWDTKSSSSPMSTGELDDNYSEPYDKGKAATSSSRHNDGGRVVDDMGGLTEKEKRIFGNNKSDE